MPRLFVAIDPPSSVKDQLLDLNEEDMAGVRWSGYDRFHLTLRFIGETHGGIARDIDDALATICVKPFEMQLNGAGYFADRRRARVLWAGVGENSNLRGLNRKIERVLVEIGLAPEHRKFRPHITLARSKTLNRAAAEHYCAKHQGFQSDPFRVETFQLISSLLTSKGAYYQAEADYPLNAEAAEALTRV